jgi:hypothetical protein
MFRNIIFVLMYHRHKLLGLTPKHTEACRWPLLSRLSHNDFVCISHNTMRDTCPGKLILHFQIAVIISVEESNQNRLNP